MRARVLGLVALLASPALAADAPHDESSSPAIICSSCHVLHKSSGGSLTTTAGNANLCASCHNSRGPSFVLPDSVQADPGASGTSHRWDAPAVNAAMGAGMPLNPELATHLRDGKLQCSTCHDQHNGAALFKGTQHVSVVVGTPITRTAGGGTGTLVLNQPLAAANPKGYRVEVVVGGATGTATFRVSNDNGMTWYGWTGAWTGGAPNGRPTGASVALNDGANVTVTFSGTFAVGDRWNFYVSYPLLRMANDQGQMCETCHSERVQSSAYIESGADGTKLFSHPIGEALLKPYDRAPANILDCNGQTQTTGDGLSTNNLRLDSANTVRCMTCHFPHHTDSNSLTEDLR
ncbi:MAG: cytochrome c3 family protein [Deltaproteobacteria bacterium]|nr:cytochrome c3 family protein [Deltaproteobacteria bacterium]